ncbi:uncharacterized protein LOC114516265 isoform X2 [Dendronephthya gigantea]|uniref:uncharacterized protein LOC114516265 isoform X2 n=1 Tax=Dendronephthya gigantea TaxID=151771 RepID=UPI00106BCC43|nr:uncharacterized protein LOC114516265 isoform X2 [Dendronephthya gigantea]
MAVNVARRKRIIAIIFAICLVTALFLYGRREGGMYNVNTDHADTSRAGLSEEMTTVKATNPLPTRKYSVVYFTEKTDKNSAEDTKLKNTVKNEDVTTTKPSLSKKTTKMSNPRLRKTREPTKMASVSSPEEPLVCKIPALDPFHPHVARLQNNVGTNLRKICRGMHPYTPAFKVVNNKLVLKKNVNQNSVVKSSIELKKIKRQGDQSFSYEKTIKPFVGMLDIHESKDIGQSDFFRVEYRIDGRRSSDLYARVSPRLDLIEKQNKIAEGFRDKGLQLNVLILGFDSTSRANFVRKLPRVKSFLETELNTYFMEGMSIVGDATTPVLTAMLTGKDETKLPEGRTSFGGKPIDNWPWVMRDYERQGYITLYAEDDPSVSAFNLRLEGFSQQPTHHYMRPFWLSLEDMHERDEPGRCSKSESMVNHTLKYINSFFDAYPSSRKFAFTFHSYLAHAHPNHLSFAEDDLMWLLRTFVDKGYLKDTMLVIMGDHGSRNSEYRDTMQGKLEERLPWFSISLPSEFHRKFPELAANLQKNQAVITSSFDVHATLRHILTYPSTPSGEQTQSLFERLPRNRTCKDAGIAEHWCPCFHWLPTDANSTDAQRIAASALKVINDKLSKETVLHSSCHKLTLDGVLDAIILQANKKVRTFDSTDQDGDRRVSYGGRTKDLKRFQIIFKTQPNGAKYEVTAHVSKQQITINPEISRLNRYNDQPACIAKQYPYARKFCYCKTQG